MIESCKTHPQTLIQVLYRIEGPSRLYYWCSHTWGSDCSYMIIIGYEAWAVAIRLYLLQFWWMIIVHMYSLNLLWTTTSMAHLYTAVMIMKVWTPPHSIKGKGSYEFERQCFLSLCRSWYWCWYSCDLLVSTWQCQNIKKITSIIIRIAYIKFRY